MRSEGEPGSWARHRLLLTAAMVLAPLAVLAVRSVVDGALAPSGDVSLIQLRVHDVGSANTPVLGSYSRFGWNQPGPLLFYVLVLPYRLLGARFAGLEVGSLLLAAASFVVVLRVAHRRFGDAGLAVAGAVCSILAWGIGPATLVDPWEPHVLVPVGFALVVLTGDVVAGHWRSLPLVVAAASLIGQASSTMLPFAVAMVVWAAVGVAWARFGRGRRDGWRPIAVALVLGVVLWMPPLAQQLTGDPGNMTAMAQSLGAEDEPTLGIPDAWRAVAGELGHHPTWVGFSQRLQPFVPYVDVQASPLLPIGGLALVLALVWGLVRFTRAPPALRSEVVLVGTVVVAAVAAVAGMSRLLGPLFLWIPRWLRVVGAAAWLAVGVTVVGSVGPRVRRGIGIGAAVVLVVTSSAMAVRSLGDWRNPDLLRDAMVALATDAAPVVRADEPVFVRSALYPTGPFGNAGEGSEELVLELERRGVSTRVTPDRANRFGERRARPDEADLELRIVPAADPVPEGFRGVATVDPLSDDDRSRRTELLEGMGLSASASNVDVLDAAAEDPALEADAATVLAMADYAPISLVLGPTPSP